MSERATPETDEWVYRWSLVDVTDDEHPDYIQDFARKLERERDEAREELLKQRVENDHNWQAVADLEQMIALARELRDVLASFEYEGNEKGTRCISCGAHCSHPHMQSCEVGCVLTKASEVLP